MSVRIFAIRMLIVEEKALENVKRSCCAVEYSEFKSRKIWK